MAKQNKPVAKMTDEALKAEYAAIDHHYFSIRTRYVDAEMLRRGFWTVELLDKVMLELGIWEK